MVSAILQDIKIYKVGSRYRFLPDGDPSAEREFASYNEALFCAIRFLCSCALVDST